MNSFNVIVAGDNPEEIMERYDLKKEVAPYPVIYIDKIKEYRENAIKTYSQALKAKNIKDNSFLKEALEYRINFLKDETNSDLDVFLELADGYEIDEETGNAISKVNPNGRYDDCNIPTLDNAVPLIKKKDGSKVFQARKGDIDWDKIHLYGRYKFERIWEMCVNKSKPKNEEEKKTYSVMSPYNYKNYFNVFKDKDTYAKSNTSFWEYAFIDKDGWNELEGNQFEWVISFYKRFISKLPDNTLLTIYNCTRKNG